MIAALVTGSLFNRAESRQSKNGKPFVSATIKAGDQFVRIVAFREEQRAEILRLRDGDAISVIGAFKAELYRPDGGEPKLSMSVFVDQVITLRASQ